MSVFVCGGDATLPSAHEADPLGDRRQACQQVLHEVAGLVGCLEELVLEQVGRAGPLCGVFHKALPNNVPHRLQV